MEVYFEYMLMYHLCLKITGLEILPEWEYTNSTLSFQVNIMAITILVSWNVRCLVVAAYMGLLSTAHSECKTRNGASFLESRHCDDEGSIPYIYVTGTYTTETITVISNLF